MQITQEKNLLQALMQSSENKITSTITTYNARCKPVETKTTRGFLESAKGIAGRFAALGVKKGDRVIVCLPNGWDWLDCWMGAVFLGALPVAASPGFSLGSGEHQQRKIFALAERIDARLLICGAVLRDEADHAPDGLTVRTPEEIRTEVTPIAFDVSDAKPEDTAYLQLTSGSTGIPKAAQISHGALQHNIHATNARVSEMYPGDDERPDTGVYWLPLFHDFGLLSTLSSMLLGRNLHLYPPQAFLSRPAEWLRQLGAHDGNVMSAGPNFSFYHCVDKITAQKVADLDLSAWRMSVVGAEMNRIETLGAFNEHFAPAKAAPDVFASAYGMAETTLIVTMDGKRKGPRLGKSDPDANGAITEVVGCGTPIDGMQVQIVGTDEAPLPEGQIGAVRVKGPSLFSGYLNNPEATAEAFADGWLVTGDLGFMRDAELYITGRIKDLLIVNGTNIMPHELEGLAEAKVGGGGMARTAAFSVPSEVQGEDVLLIVEVDRNSTEEDLRTLRTEISGHITQELGIPLTKLEFVLRGAIPRTTSGKLQRGVLKQMYQDNELKIISV